VLRRTISFHISTSMQSGMQNSDQLLSYCTLSTRTVIVSVIVKRYSSDKELVFAELSSYYNNMLFLDTTNMNFMLTTCTILS